MRLGKGNTVYNFITRLEPDDIVDIADDIRLLRDGYTFFYAIDTFDVFNHFLPYVDSNLFKGANRNDVAHKMIAYNEFFTSASRERIIIPEEYRLELLDIKRYLENQIRQLHSLKQNFIDLEEAVTGIMDVDQDNYEELRNNFEFVLTLLILAEREDKGNKGLFNFIADAFSQNVLLEREGNHAYINALLDDSPPSADCAAIFERFVTNRAYTLLGMESDEKRYKYLKNSFRDIEAIDRLNTVNKKIVHDHENAHKVMLLYLSSASNKSKEIMSIIAQGKDNRILLSPLESSKGFDFHRNIDQTFLFRVLTEDPTYKDNPDLQNDTLLSLKRLAHQVRVLRFIRHREDYLEVTGIDAPILMVFQRTLDKHSSRIDNHFYFKLFERYKERGLQMTERVLLVDIIKKAESFLARELTGIKKALTLHHSVDNFIQTSFIKSLFYPSDQMSFRVSISFGKDVIQNSFQHFPYLVFAGDPDEVTAADSLYKAFDIMTEIKHADEGQRQELMPYFKALYTQVPKRTGLERRNFEFIITTYLNLIATPEPAAGTAAEGLPMAISEEKVINLLRKEIKIIEHATVESHLEEHQRLVIEAGRSKYVQEMQYMLLWLLRRDGELDQAAELGDLLIKNYPDDPRYLHGMGLCRIAQAYDLMDPEKVGHNSLEHIIFLLQDAIEKLKAALEHYDSLAGVAINPSLKRLVAKSKIAIQNSIADSSLRLHKIQQSKDDKLLSESRSHLLKLKADIERAELLYDDYPTFNHTEAELEYYEALQYFLRGNVAAAHLKIVAATERVLVFQKQKAAIAAHFLNVIPLIDSLRKTIFIKKGIIK